MIGVSIAVGLGLIVRARHWLRGATRVDREITVRAFVEIVALATLIVVLAIAVTLIASTGSR